MKKILVMAFLIFAQVCLGMNKEESFVNRLALSENDYNALRLYAIEGLKKRGLYQASCWSKDASLKEHKVPSKKTIGVSRASVRVENKVKRRDLAQLLKVPGVKLVRYSSHDMKTILFVDPDSNQIDTDENKYYFFQFPYKKISGSLYNLNIPMARVEISKEDNITNVRKWLHRKKRNSKKSVAYWNKFVLHIANYKALGLEDDLFFIYTSGTDKTSILKSNGNFYLQPPSAKEKNEAWKIKSAVLFAQKIIK